MQYILSLEELREYQKKAAEHVDQDELQKLCTLAADHVPVQWPWEPMGILRPWTCILTKNGGYCDECPSKQVCPYPNKRWSK